MDRHALRLGIRSMDRTAKTSRSLGGRTLGPQAGWLGLGCRALEVIQRSNVGGQKSEIVRGDLCFKVVFLWHAWNNPSSRLTGDETYTAIHCPGTAVPVNGLLFSFRYG